MKPTPTIKMDEAERERNYGKKIFENDEFIIRIKPLEAEKGNYFVKAHRKRDGAECLPLAWMLGSNCMEVKF